MGCLLRVRHLALFQVNLPACYMLSRDIVIFLLGKPRRRRKSGRQPAPWPARAHARVAPQPGLFPWRTMLTSSQATVPRAAGERSRAPNKPEPPTSGSFLIHEEPAAETRSFSRTKEDRALGEGVSAFQGPLALLEKEKPNFLFPQTGK